MSPSRIGTSVSVAKYMNAPTTEAKRLAAERVAAHRLLIHELGMRPRSEPPGPPSRKPATSTPPSRSGRICLAKVQLESTHRPSSSFLNQATTAGDRAPERRHPSRIHFAEWIAAQTPPSPAPRACPSWRRPGCRPWRRSRAPSCHSARPFGSSGSTTGPVGLPCGLLLAEDEVHEQADDHGEGDGAHRPGDAELRRRGRAPSG